MKEEEKKIEKFKEMKKPENYEVNKHFSKNLLQKLGRSNIADYKESYEFAANRTSAKSYIDMFSIKYSQR